MHLINRSAMYVGAMSSCRKMETFQIKRNEYARLLTQRKRKGKLSQIRTN